MSTDTKHCCGKRHGSGARHSETILMSAYAVVPPRSFPHRAPMRLDLTHHHCEVAESPMAH
jgi:hypothetical protein